MRKITGNTSYLIYKAICIVMILLSGCENEHDGSTVAKMPIKYDLFVLDEFDSSPIKNLSIETRECTRPGADQVCGYYRLGCTDNEGHYSGLIEFDSNRDIYVQGNLCSGTFPKPYTSYFSEYVAETKTETLYLTTYAYLDVKFEQQNTYADGDSILLYLNNSLYRKYSCTGEKFFWPPQVLAHQYTKIKWIVKAGGTEKTFVDSLFAKPMSDDTYLLKY